MELGLQHSGNSPVFTKKTAMLRSYLKSAFRSLLKKRTYSFLNISGLAIGIACASLIFLWVEDEISYNHHFARRNLICRILENQTYEGKVSTFNATPGPMAKSLPVDIPGIKIAARSAGEGQQLFTLGEKSFNETGSYVDSGLIAMLDIPLAYGNSAGSFHDIHSLMISETMAKKFFGDTDPVGRTLKVNNDKAFTIKAVFRDLPENSSFHFHWIAPIQNIEGSQPWMNDWSANWTQTYVELDPGTNPASVDRKMKHYLSTKNETNKTECFLFSMNDWNLHNHFTSGKPDGGKIQYVRLFTAIAWVILLIACINFMNLSTARSEQRAREVGVRKVMGASRTRLQVQFIGEAIFISFVSVLFAIGLIYLALPSFNLLVEKNLKVHLLSPVHLLYLFIIGTVTGLVAGSYPAFYLSSFNPVAVLKSIKIRSSAGSGFIRKSLVVMQFSLSIIFMISTAIIFRQIQHVKSRELGYNKNNLIYMEIQGDLVKNFNTIHHELLGSGLVENASLSDYPVLELWTNTDNYTWEGKDASKNVLVSWQNVNSSFISTMQMKLKAGRDFSPAWETDSNHVIINEALASQMGSQGHVGGIIRDGGRPVQIIGILENYVYNSMYQPGAPLIFFNHPQGTRTVSVRLKNGRPLQSSLARIEEIFRANNPGYPADFRFADQEFNQLFKTETLTGKLASVFAILAIGISCLGLFGLAAYTAERRVKEFGIRKVLGANAAGLARLLSADFVRLIGYSCAIAFPLAWWFLNQWLQQYEYRASMSLWIFMAVGILAMLIALATVSFQALKAALANPVRSLRSE